MSAADWVIVAVVGAALAAVLVCRFLRRREGRGGCGDCGGDCTHCHRK